MNLIFAPVLIFQFCPRSKKVDDETLLNKPFGNCMEFMESVAKTFYGPVNGKNDTVGPQDLSSTVEAAHQVARCGYEDGTAWGLKVWENYHILSGNGNSFIQKWILLLILSMIFIFECFHE